MHDWFDAGLSALVADGTLVGYRGKGAIWAADTGRDAIPVRNEMLVKGVVVRGIGTAIAMCPPLVATEAEVGQILDVMVSCL